MGTDFNLKEVLLFQVIFAKLCFGNGPFENISVTDEDCKEDEPGGSAVISMQLKGGPHVLRELLGKGVATAQIIRHPTGVEKTGQGVPVRGQMEIGGTKDGYVEITGLLPPYSFDAVVAALISGGDQLMARAHLKIGLKEERKTINYHKKEGPLDEAQFLINDLAVLFDIGEEYDDNLDD